MVRASRLGTVLVRGPSMRPSLQDGDWLLVRWGGGVRRGSLVVARPVERPELLVVKRAVAPLSVTGEGTLWDVASDDPSVRGLGWTGGPAEVLGTVLLRWWPLRWWTWRWWTGRWWTGRRRVP